MYQQRVYAVCRRLTGAHQSADDLAQETFIKAYYALARFDAAWPLYPWLRKIAVNSALNYLEDPGPGAVARRRLARPAARARGRAVRRSGGAAGAGRVPGAAGPGGGIPAGRPEERLRPEVPREPELRGDLPGARPAARDRHVAAQPRPAEAEGPPGRFPRQGSLR
ncbi:MAG: sigma-70 family RNA polymerase sigma factor [Candidatus Moduliflexus flocculans]|nr:sigma-70 family RNA polymerase sigma factor [Candidatus Moduliflexus flocculans]